MNYNPRFPNQGQILRKHHRALCIKNKALKQVFPKPPMAGLRQHKNLKRLLCKPRLEQPPTDRPSRSSRTTPGWKPCKGNRSGCPICPYTAKATSKVVSDFNGYTHKITDDVNCQSENVLYLWRCKKLNCKDHPKTSYVGKTRKSFQQRFSQHRDYVKREVLTKPAGEHFNLPGHTVADIEGLVLEQVKDKDPFVLKVREHKMIQRFDTFRNGLNKES